MKPDLDLVRYQRTEPPSPRSGLVQQSRGAEPRDDLAVPKRTPLARVRCCQLLHGGYLVVTLPTMRAERAKLKSCKDDETVAQGKRSAALGCGRKMILFPSSPVRRAAGAPDRGGRKRWGGLLPRAAAPAALLDYCLAAPSGRRKGEPSGFRQGRDRASVDNRTSAASVSRLVPSVK